MAARALIKSMLLISVHLPKTAGTSFAEALQCHFGDQLVRDYGDFPINTPALRRNAGALLNSARNLLADWNGVECIHGHFLPLKYRLLARIRPVLFITWMRDPVERLISLYDFWQRSYDPATSPPVHRRVVQEQWSLERFCLSPEMRDTYSQFLWGFPLSRFDFIGIAEHYERDLEFFNRHVLGVHLPILYANANPNRERYRERLDGALRARIQEYHERDMRLYRQALARRQAREQGPAPETAFRPRPLRAVPTNSEGRSP